MKYFLRRKFFQGKNVSWWEQKLMTTMQNKQNVKTKTSSKGNFLEEYLN